MRSFWRAHQQKFQRIKMHLFLVLALALSLLIPAPHRRPAVESRLFSVVGGDYISPLISSAVAIRALNAQLGSSARYAGYDQLNAFVNVGSGPILASVTRYAGDIFSLLSAQTLLQSKAGADQRPAYISEAFWKRAYGGSPDVLGRTIHVGNETLQIAGVVRCESVVLAETDVWEPICTRGPYGTMTALRVLGQLQPGASWRAGEKNLTAIMQMETVRQQVVELNAVRLLPVERKMIVYAREGSPS